MITNAQAHAIPIDDFAAPSDNTDLDASTSAHGLLKKLDNDTAHFLRGDGAWATPPAGSVTLPTVISVGSSFSSTGVPTATLPGTHALNDILILALQSSNDSSVAVAGYTQLGPQNAIGAASTAATTKLSLFWKRDGGSEVAPTIPDTGDHTFGVMFAVRGCPTVGDPFHFLGNTFKFITSLAGTSPKGTTVIDNCLVVDIWGQGVDSAAAQGSSPTNADLGSVTEQFDGGTADGTGGGIYIMSGTKAAAGDIVASTLTWANTTVDVSSRIAFIPENTTEINNSPKPVQVQVFIGTPADLDDLWVKPSGATFVRAQICDGGGSGSGGNTTGTAAGGGGGGGGGYGEAQYLAADLAATISVHAGKGGAAVALGAAGNPGIVSQFDKGGVGPLTSAYRIAGAVATAAITADGGNGGCGSGVASQAVVTTRIALGAGTPNVGAGGIGAAGGSGTTAPVGGSESESGGGGGESGADSDGAILSANNGNSRYGAGGGASGRTNGNISGSGAGGGAAGVINAQGASGTNSTHLPYGGSGGCGGGTGTAAGGSGGFPGGGGGGGGGVANGGGGSGGHGCVVVTTFF